jgi:hypothetical protein
MQGAVTLPYATTAVGTSVQYDFYGSSIGLESTDLYANNLRLFLTTVAPTRATVEVPVPLDYAGIYNVTDDAGTILSRRYVREPRFVDFAIERRITVGVREMALYLVPRSVFHDTRFADLLEGKALPAALADALSFSQNGTTSANSDVLQMVLAGHLDDVDLMAMKDLLTRNVTGNVTYQWIDVTSYLPLFNLPDDAIRLAGYRPFPHALTVNYTWDVVAGTRNGWSEWDCIWAGLVACLDEVLAWIESGIVFVGAVVDDVVDAIVQFGSWLADLTSGDPVRMANAVRAAQKVPDQFVDWIVDSVVVLVTLS